MSVKEIIKTIVYSFIILYIIIFMIVSCAYGLDYDHKMVLKAKEIYSRWVVEHCSCRCIMSKGNIKLETE